MSTKPKSDRRKLLDFALGADNYELDEAIDILLSVRDSRAGNKSVPAKPAASKPKAGTAAKKGLPARVVKQPDNPAGGDTPNANPAS